MAKRIVLLLAPFVLSFLMIGLVITAVSTPTTHAAVSKDTSQNNITATPPTGAGIPVSRHNNGLINTDYLMVYGPEICTAWGDPFSPISPTWSAIPGLNPTDYQGLHTYRFRIRIPANYPDNIVRIELFDPDSINQAENNATVIHSNTARVAGFPSGIVEMSCQSTSQKAACAIQTGEAALVDEAASLTYDHINPLWFMRVDENRGVGTNLCGNFPHYSPETNTQTRYTLSYYAISDTNSSNQVVLGSYTGQVGDGVRDNGDHDTDLRWVSPGAAQSADQPTFVPSDQGSFEVDLDQDILNISVDPLTGEKLLYLDVTSLSGGSRNGFSIWAGPNDYIDSTSSNISIRNLQILSNPDAHDGKGIKVEAVENLPHETLIADHMDFPVVELGPEYAGQTITVSLFDPDVGSKPPIIFYMDTLAFNSDYDQLWDGIDWDGTDWAVSFGSTYNPEFGCFKGGDNYNSECDNAWVSYQISLPDEETNCYEHPVRGEECIPFYGGQLLTRFKGGTNDAHIWHVEVPERPLSDNTPGCSAFPIGVDESIRSVLPPGEVGTNAWPTFDYPNPQPNYYSYGNHLPSMLLENAQPGYLYNLSPVFLAWNVCTTSSTDLTNSLTWPGNSNDYTPIGGTCSANGEPKFPGYMEIGDPTDRSLNKGDWIALNTGSISSNSVRDAIEGHIDIDRVLRLPVWDDQTGSGANAAVKASRFGLFRIVGYGLSQGGGESTILVEFIDWDDSCGQNPITINNIALNGATTGLINTNYTFTATVSPIDPTPPITVVWSATGNAPITLTNQIETSQIFQWPTGGTKTITATATNSYGDSVTATMTTHISLPPIPLTSVTIQPQPEIVGNVVTITAVTLPNTATRPITYTWHVNNQTITHTTGFTDTTSFTLPYSSTQTITVTASNGVGQPVTETIEVTIEPLRVFLPAILKPEE